MFDCKCLSKTAWPYKSVRCPDCCIVLTLELWDELTTSCNALTDSACSSTNTHAGRSGVTFYYSGLKLIFIN